eukprot:TRINITY_DN396_c0_g1_i1.p1 TRINITY_DN396_c0_g1~~TRINITY_DN396_c0_g1_i1.p1  ORF type:complete len:219 (-),score=50.09 TRINITY_DN396_c0_g1_i1:52-708(-)
MRKGLLFGLVIVLILFSSEQALCWDDDDIDEELRFVTCGSAIKLRHVKSGFRLHSHKVTYGSGSGQQSVTGFPNADDPNSLWVVKGAYQKPCLQGTVLKNGDVIRLQHLATRKNLHSHLHKSPLTQNNEVSAFAEGEEGDTGDNWRIVLQKDGKWVRGESVRFQHLDTNGFLQGNPNAQYQSPIPGQIEIAGVNNVNDNNEWVNDEGIYFPERSDKGE